MTLTGKELFDVVRNRQWQRLALADLDVWEILLVANHRDTPPATAEALYAYQHRRRYEKPRGSLPPHAA